MSDAYELALIYVNQIGALAWAAEETDDPSMKESFIKLLKTPLERLMEAMKKLKEEL